MLRTQREVPTPLLRDTEVRNLRLLRQSQEVGCGGSESPTALSLTHFKTRQFFTLAGYLVLTRLMTAYVDDSRVLIGRLMRRRVRWFS